MASDHGHVPPPPFQAISPPFLAPSHLLDNLGVQNAMDQIATAWVRAMEAAAGRLTLSAESEQQAPPDARCSHSIHHKLTLAIKILQRTNSLQAKKQLPALYTALDRVDNADKTLAEDREAAALHEGKGDVFGSEAFAEYQKALSAYLEALRIYWKVSMDENAAHLHDDVLVTRNGGADQREHAKPATASFLDDEAADEAYDVVSCMHKSGRMLMMRGFQSMQQAAEAHVIQQQQDEGSGDDWHRSEGEQRADQMEARRREVEAWWQARIRGQQGGQSEHRSALRREVRRC